MINKRKRYEETVVGLTILKTVGGCRGLLFLQGTIIGDWGLMAASLSLFGQCDSPTLLRRGGWSPSPKRSRGEPTC
jgi:hypothetical protein